VCDVKESRLQELSKLANGIAENGGIVFAYAFRLVILLCAM